MDFELAEEYRMLRDLVQRFVREELIPLEAGVLERDAEGKGAYLTASERERLNKVSKEMGLWSLDAPEDAGGMGMPHVALVGVNEALGSTVAQYTLPPDSPNLQMLMATVNDQQRTAYLEPYARGETVSAIGISEPGAGADPAGMLTRAVRDGDDWVINGRKIWITRAAEADFTILMAIGPMQIRLGTRRMEMAAWCIGAAQRALDMMVEYAPQRVTFGQKLSQRQSVQWWVADGAAKIHAARLMAYDCAWKLDNGRDVRTEISMLKYYATEMAQEMIDNAMQCFGAMGMTKEMPLHLFAGRIRNMRIYDGPSEVHRMVVARNLMDTR